MVVTVAGLAGFAATCREPEAEVLPYRLVPVEIRNIAVSATAAGTVEPIQTVEIKSKASGEIFAVTVDVGDSVRAGQVLVRVDPRVPRNALTQAEADLEVAKAQLANAEAQLRRAEALYQSQSITEQEWEDAKLSHASANAQLIRSQRALEDARIAFQDTEVRAASPGIILSRQVEVGTVIQSASSGLSGGATLLTMANLDTVQVRTLVDETDIGKVVPGQRVTMRVEAYPNQPFQGRVLKVEPSAQVQQNVTMFPVLIRIANERGLLRPGMNAEVEIHIADRRDIPAVPNAALRTERDVFSAASVIGLDADSVRRALEVAGPTSGPAPTPVPSGPAGGDRTVTIRGREVTVPDDVDLEAFRAIQAKLDAAGGGREAFRTLTDEERQLFFGVMRAAGGGPGRGGGPPGNADGRAGPRAGGNPAPTPATAGLAPSEHIVFVMRDGRPVPARISTGLTDLDYTEVLSGLTATDSVLVLTGGA